MRSLSQQLGEFVQQRLCLLASEVSLTPPVAESGAAVGVGDGHNSDHQSASCTVMKKWPSMLMYLISVSQDDEWIAVLRRIITHPEEINQVGKNGGMTALHAACIRYPPVHIVQALVTASPTVALQQNFSGETSLHLASYSASEQVQACLLKAAPQAASYRDQYGDCPLHFAARTGATLPLLSKMVHAAPEAISHANEKGVTPFWLLPRTFVQADSLEEILNDGDGDDEDDYRHDWDAMTLFLRYSYYGKERAAAMMARDGQDGITTSKSAHDYAWLVHAAAATPACPRQILAFLCRMFPDQALQLDEQGYTPLQLAVRAPVLDDEPTFSSESEDGIREPLHSVPHDKLPNDDARHDHVAPQDDSAALAFRDVDFVQSITESSDDDDDDMPPPSVLKILLDWSPEAITVRDFQGRLPLTNAIVAGHHSWESIQGLIAACPQTIEQDDPVTQFSHAQLAARYSNDLDTIFALVRSLPQHVSPPSSSARSSSQKKRNSQQKTGSSLSTLSSKRCRLC